MKKIIAVFAVALLAAACSSDPQPIVEEPLPIVQETQPVVEEASCASFATPASELPGSIIYQVWDRETDNTDIYAMNPDGTNIRSLANSEDKELLSDAGSISPDGESILFLKVENIDDPDFEYAKSVNIFIMNSDGTNQRQLTNFGRQVTAHSPIWSPDATP